MASNPVMDHDEEHDLDHIVRQRGPLPVRQAVDYLIQAARILETAHAQGIVHRDIKPGNLIVDGAGIVHIRAHDLPRFPNAGNFFRKAAVTDLTQTGADTGAVDFTAPELGAGAPPG